MRILGLQKTTLLDYPHKVACTIFLGGCNFQCPFCHNAQIINESPSLYEYSMDDLFTFLNKRKHILEGVCITGGEPTLYSDLPNFIQSIQSLGYQVKLDTNGSNPFMLEQLLKNNLLDYVAMDIKNSAAKYSDTTGCNTNIHLIDQSVQILKSCDIPYEFRTTVIKELHTMKDFKQIGQWIEGASQYYLQNFINSPQVLCPNQFTSYTMDELLKVKQYMQGYVSLVGIRGID